MQFLSTSRQLSIRQLQHSSRHRKSSLAWSHGEKKVEEAASSIKPSANSHLSWQQVRSVLLSAAVPMIGFGFMDNFIMIQAGSMIDNTIGVQLGLATMTAAALGQVISDTCGVLFGGTLDRILAIRPVQLTVAQQKLPLIPRLRLAGAVFGVMLGCSIGAVVGLAIGAPVEHDENERLKALHHLQQVLEDTMTNPEDKWAASHATCTLFVTGDISNHSWNPKTSTAASSVQSLSSTEDFLASQCAADSHAVVFEHSVYMPVLHSQSKALLGVLKVEHLTGKSKSNLEDVKQVARNVGYIMARMMD
ncbi:transmembrane protein [Nitzschia inconspicua]|uniref:Transmembrane protein n=1 Tax=Nitzschia inconspicua TaxID=303405 RepID=A0A9K3KUP9_9STRA|nr:transmembrane protein [Nitzschia inconspicua]